MYIFWCKSTNCWCNGWSMFQSKPLGAACSSQSSLQSAVRAVLLWSESCHLPHYSLGNFLVRSKAVIQNLGLDTLRHVSPVWLGSENTQLSVMSDNGRTCTPAKMPNFITWIWCLNTTFYFRPVNTEKEIFQNKTVASTQTYMLLHFVHREPKINSHTNMWMRTWKM